MAVPLLAKFEIIVFDDIVVTVFNSLHEAVDWPDPVYLLMHFFKLYADGSVNDTAESFLLDILEVKIPIKKKKHEKSVK